MSSKLEATEPDTVERRDDAASEESRILPKSGVDDAFALATAEPDETWTEEEQRRLLWKIDLIVLPLVSKIDI